MPDLVSKYIRLISGWPEETRREFQSLLKDLSTQISWDDIRVAAQNMKNNLASPPDWVQIADDGAGSDGVFALAFDDSTEESTTFDIQIPHRWSPGSDIHPHVHWTPASTGAGNVRWGLEYIISGADNTFTNTVYTYGTHSGPFTAGRQYITSLTEINMDGFLESTILACRLFRDATNASDTYADDAYILSSDFHFQVEKDGTSEEFPNQVSGAL